MAQCVAGVLIGAVLPAQAAERVAAAYVSRFAGVRYRLRGYQWDQVLGQRWAVYEDTIHPERPLLSERDPEGTSVSEGVAAATPPVASARPMAVAEMVVRSGDAVTLWRQEANVRMQLSAVAEGNAAVGERVQMRVTGAGIFGNTGWRATGLVRGPGSVEME